MAKAKKFEFEKPVPVTDDEDEGTLAAIDEGIADAKANRTVPIAEVRKILSKWIAGPPSHKEN
jgi:predicted transcriptional regulator